MFEDRYIEARNSNKNLNFYKIHHNRTVKLVLNRTQKQDFYSF